jgi:prevent-host-death family protein
MKTIAQRELRNDNARVIEAVVAGEMFIVTRNGIPVVEVRPIAHRRRTFMPMAEMRAVTGVGPAVEAKTFFGDLDRVVDQDL